MKFYKINNPMYKTMVSFYKFKKEIKTLHPHPHFNKSHTNVPIIYNSYVKYNKIQYNKDHTIHFRN